MAIGLIGKKAGMTRVFVDGGTQVAVTVVEVGPCTIVGKRTLDVDNYTAVRLGYGVRKASRITKPRAGEAAKAGVDAPVLTREFRVSGDELAKFEVGQKVEADLFSKGQAVDVVGNTKGRGFQGVFKRHNMAGFVEGHGTHEYFRHVGSIGQRKTPGRVFKNKRMPGHMGTNRVTIQNLQVVAVDAANGIVLVRGAIPGNKGSLVTIKPSVKAKK